MATRAASKRGPVHIHTAGGCGHPLRHPHTARVVAMAVWGWGWAQGNADAQRRCWSSRQRRVVVPTEERWKGTRVGAGTRRRPAAPISLAARGWRGPGEGLLHLPPRPLPPAAAAQASGHHADGAGSPRFGGVWISRGKGLGHGYGKTVGRRCLNEPQLLQAVHTSPLGLTLNSLELADVPFLEQLRHFRRAWLVTGMHGAGYSNIIFLPPRAVVAELCPLGYCTQSYERLSARLDLVYLRWTNSISENAKPGFDTIVDVEQFLGLMRRATSALHGQRTGNGDSAVESQRTSIRGALDGQEDD